MDKNGFIFRLKQQLQTSTPKWVLAWMVVNWIAALLAMGALGILSLIKDIVIYLTNFNDANSLILSIIASLLFGSIIGYGQWLVLQIRFSKTKSWIFSTALAGVFILVAFGYLYDVIYWSLKLFILPWLVEVDPFLPKFLYIIFENFALYEYTPSIILALILGIVLGIVQWLFLRRRICKAIYWISINLASFILAYLNTNWIVDIISNYYRTHMIIDHIKIDNMVLPNFFFLYALLSGIGFGTLLKYLKSVDE